MVNLRKETYICITILIFIIRLAAPEEFIIGYLTGSLRRPGNKGYPRPGLTISGAITLAVDEVNNYYPLRNNSKLTFQVAETYGEEQESIYKVAKLWTENVSVYVGPQETCIHEAKVASSFNLLMISYVSTNLYSLFFKCVWSNV